MSITKYLAKISYKVSSRCYLKIFWNASLCRKRGVTKVKKLEVDFCGNKFNTNSNAFIQS